jgi:hypothetical protein
MLADNKILSDLSEKSLLAIKISFEDEGLDFIDALFMKTYCDINKIKLCLKLGGAEAIRDIKDANKLNAQKIIAPMIESDFALEKYIKSAEIFYHVPDGEIGINIESVSGYNNLNRILSSKYCEKLDSITIGRGDLVESLSLNRNNGSVDSGQILEICQAILSGARKCNLHTYIGGAMTKNSEHFCLSLINDNLLDYFETRNTIFSKDALKYYSFSDLIEASKTLEYSFLLKKQKYYSSLANQDITRINKIKNN